MTEKIGCVQHDCAECVAREQRKWVGLTDEEIDKEQDEAGRAFRRHRSSIRGQMVTPADSFEWHFAQAIEAKLKEKNT